MRKHIFTTLAVMLFYFQLTAQKPFFKISKSIPDDIKALFQSNEKELIERMSHFKCDSIVILTIENQIVIRVDVALENELVTNQQLGKPKARYFFMDFPTSIMSTLSWGLAGITIRSNNPYLKDLDIMVKLKRGNDAIAFFSSTFYDEIWLRYKGKFYQIQSSRNGKGVGVFYIGEPFNLDGTKTDNFYLCEMLNLPTKN